MTSDEEYDEVTGLPKDRSYLEQGLPKWLAESVHQMELAWEKREKGKYLNWDCDYCELQSNINIAETEHIITSEQAWYLREKYLRMEKTERTDRL
jgi:hypothetical protein